VTLRVVELANGVAPAPPPAPRGQNRSTAWSPTKPAQVAIQTRYARCALRSSRGAAL